MKIAFLSYSGTPGYYCPPPGEALSPMYSYQAIHFAQAAIVSTSSCACSLCPYLCVCAFQDVWTSTKRMGSEIPVLMYP